MIRRIILILFVVISLLLVGSGCKKNIPSPTATVSPLFSPTSPLSSPSPETKELDIPTPSPGSGNVTGVLIHYTFESPIEGVNVYLAPVLTSDDQKMEMAKFDKVMAVGTLTDQTGRFVFQGIAPGRYALILGGAINDYLLADYRTQEDVVFDLEADQVLEIGEVWIIPPEDV